jgi:ribonuclease BN (tRNA processing enzyme)
MKLIFLGSGSAFTVGTDNFHSNMLLENEKGQHLLIDCGSDIRFSLHALGLNHRDIHQVYVSHLHADHVGGLEWLAFTTKFDVNCDKPKLFICDKLVTKLWDTVLSGGLSSLQTEIADLSTYFNVHPIPENGFFEWHQVKFQIVQTLHIISGFSIMPSFGVMFMADNLKVFITTDTQFSPHQIKDYYDMADLIFHDCETTPQRSNVHAHYQELTTLPANIKNKMWLYHYNPTPLPDAKKDGFKGFVKRGQTFDFTDPNTY